MEHENLKHETQYLRTKMQNTCSHVHGPSAMTLSAPSSLSLSSLASDIFFQRKVPQWIFYPFCVGKFPASLQFMK